MICLLKLCERSILRWEAAGHSRVTVKCNNEIAVSLPEMSYECAVFIYRMQFSKCRHRHRRVLLVNWPVARRWAGRRLQ